MKEDGHIQLFNGSLQRSGDTDGAQEQVVGGSSGRDGSPRSVRGRLGGKEFVELYSAITRNAYKSKEKCSRQLHKKLIFLIYSFHKIIHDSGYCKSGFSQIVLGYKLNEKVIFRYPDDY